MRGPVVAALLALPALLALAGAIPAAAQAPDVPMPGAVEGVHLHWRPDLGQYAVRFHSPLPGQQFAAQWIDANGTAHPAPIVVTVPQYGGGSSTYGFRFPAEARQYRIGERTFDVRSPPPAPQDTVRVAFVADVGMTPDTQSVLAAARAAGASAILAGGDLSYADGDRAVWDRWFTFMEPFIADVPFIPARGNHEGRCLPVAAQNVAGDCVTDEQVYLARFDLPLAELHYATEWGPLRIVVLDSEAYHPRDDPLGRVHNTDADEQRSFLADALRAPDGRWEIVMFHRPMYSSSGAHGSEFVLRDHLRDTLEAGGADLVLAGHDHDYERTHALRDGVPVDLDAVVERGQGPVYVVSGGGGQSLYSSWQPTPDWSAHRAAEFHFLLIEADPQTLRVSAVRADGSVLDEVTFVQAGAAQGTQDAPAAGWLAAAGLLSAAAVLRASRGSRRPR